MLSIGLLFVVVVWLGYHYGQYTAADGEGDEQLALDAVGGWWNVAGDRYLELDWEGRRATLWDYSGSEVGAKSQGSWRTTSAAVVVEVTGEAGSLTRKFEIVGNEAEVFLAPVPASQAKLMESWIADHGDAQDDVAPSGPSPREAASRRTARSRNLGRKMLGGHLTSSLSNASPSPRSTQ